jgi:NhaA family Na+:H+ antiporter
MTRMQHFAARHFIAFPIGAVIALFWANSHPETYYVFAHAWAFPVNNLGMVVFFALVTAEIVDAAEPGGALHTWRRMALPFVAAVGGMFGSTLGYFAYLRMGDEFSVLSRGWPIPGAVDLVVGYVLVRGVFRRHAVIPFFLLAGVAADLFGAAVVELRYPVAEQHLVGVALIAAGICVAVLLRRAGVTSFWPFILISGTLSWWGFFLSGLHPAFALVPIVPFLAHIGREQPPFTSTPDNGLSRFDRIWSVPSQIGLLLFALVNAGVMFKDAGTATKAVAIAAFAGKPLGMLAAVAIAVAGGLHLPRSVGRRELVVVALTSSIAFSFGLFFATAAMAPGPVLAETKVGALLTVGGALLALTAAAGLRIGRFARNSSSTHTRGERAKRRARAPRTVAGV